MAPDKAYDKLVLLDLEIDLLRPELHRLSAIVPDHSLSTHRLEEHYN